MSARHPNSESRRSEFKNQGLTQDEFRRRREENSVELRKAKKEDTLNKRRNIVDTKPAFQGHDNQAASFEDYDTADSQDFEVQLLNFYFYFYFVLSLVMI